MGTPFPVPAPLLQDLSQHQPFLSPLSTPSLPWKELKWLVECPWHPLSRNTACVFSCSVMSNSVTPWTVAHQAPLSTGFPRQEYWSGCHFLLQGIFLTHVWNLCFLQCRQILYHWAMWVRQEFAGTYKKEQGSPLWRTCHTSGGGAEAAKCSAELNLL